MLRYSSGDTSPARPLEAMKVEPTNEKSAISLSLLDSIKMAIESSSVRSVSEVHELQDKAVINRRDAVVSYRILASQSRTLFVIQWNEQMAGLWNAYGSRLDKAIDTSLGVIWPWKSTPKKIR